MGGTIVIVTLGVFLSMLHLGWGIGMRFRGRLQEGDTKCPAWKTLSLSANKVSRGYRFGFFLQVLSLLLAAVFFQSDWFECFLVWLVRVVPYSFLIFSPFGWLDFSRWFLSFLSVYFALRLCGWIEGVLQVGFRLGFAVSFSLVFLHLFWVLIVFFVGGL